jgi:hypothetical protein
MNARELQITLGEAVSEDSGVNSDGAVDRHCEELFFSRRAMERDDNLLFVRERTENQDRGRWN